MSIGGNSIIRPSSLPKIAVCASFQSRGGSAGGAAERGTLMDEAFRLTCAGERLTLTSCGAYLPPGGECRCGERHTTGKLVDPLEVLEERIEALADRFPGYSPEPGREATEWTVKRARLISEDIETREDKLRVSVPGIAPMGTADMLFPSLLEHGDMKTGQIRNYREQMAAYAYGFMELFFADRWRAHLLFCDQREVVTHDFTYKEAREIVEGVIAAAQSPARKATPNEYCSWCGLYETCHARRELATRAFTYTNIQERWDQIKDDPEELAAFLGAADALGDFVAEGKQAALALIEAGIAVEGWKRVAKKGSEYVDAETLVALAQQHKITVGQIIRAVGNFSGSKVRALFKGAGVEVPERIFQTHGGSVYLSKNSRRAK